MSIEKEKLIDIDFEKIAFLQRESFISTINHDLKIPILAQIRALELLTEEKMGNLNNGQKELINLTLDSCRSMYEMLSEILTAYKYENKDIILDYENINILKFVEEFFNKSNGKIYEKGLKILIRNNSYSPIFFGDKFQFKKAFECIANYCISRASNNSEFICSINDSDECIHISLLFDSPYFYRNKLETFSDGRMDKVGSTLGLYLAKKIIYAHKGSIETSFENSLNQLNINLPLINVKRMTR